MNKNAIILVLAVLIVVGSLSFSSAYYYSNPSNFRTYNTGYSYNAPQEAFVYPSYEYSPSINDKIFASQEDSFFSTRNYQGPIFDKTTTFDSYLKISRSGKVIQTISAKTTEKFIGEQEMNSASSQNSALYKDDYSLSSPNPTRYIGGSYWKSQPSYNYQSYGKDSYSNGYYYKPMYDSSLGYYNWRY